MTVTVEGGPPKGMVGDPYHAELTATTGTPPYTWTSNPPLPEGLTLDSPPPGLRARIDGTPQGPAKSVPVTYSITVTDDAHDIGHVDLVINPKLAISTPHALPAATEGKPYTSTLAAAGGASPYTWTAPDAPAGLSIDRDTGAIAWESPTDTQFAIRVIDNVGHTDEQSFTITVRPVHLTSMISNLHLGALALGAASTVLVALRLISVAKFNPETAYAILQASGTGNVIIGTVISLIPSIAIIVALYVISARVLSQSPQTDPQAELARWTLIFMLALIALLTIPFRYVIYAGPVILVFLGFIVTIVILKIRVKRKGLASGSWLKRDWGKIGTAAAIFSAFLIALLVMLGVVFSPPWMPAERLTLNNNQKIIGYVLAQDQEGLTFMQAKSRKITQYNPGVVIGQVFCSNAPARDLPIIFYIKSIPGLGLGHYLGTYLSHYAHC
jgi:Putative Ig domain